MPAINFKPQFVPLIREGRKTHTIRKTKRAEVGDTLFLYTGMRTSNCKLIEKVKCTFVLPIKILPWEREVRVKQNESWYNLSTAQVKSLAVYDGFENDDMFFIFFEEHYYSEVYRLESLYLHGWKELPWYLEPNTKRRK